MDKLIILILINTVLVADLCEYSVLLRLVKDRHWTYSTAPNPQRGWWALPGIRHYIFDDSKMNISDVQSSTAAARGKLLATGWFKMNWLTCRQCEYPREESQVMVHGLQCYDNSIPQNVNGNENIVQCFNGSCVTIIIEPTGEVINGCWILSKVPTGRYIFDFCNTNLCNGRQVSPNLMMLFRNGHDNKLMNKLK